MTNYEYSLEVERALAEERPVVALESTVVTHGLPYPQNLALAKDMEAEIRSQGCIPATIAVLNGKVHIGLDEAALERLAAAQGMRKISARDFGPAVALRQSGGTTVAGTLLAASGSDIEVFATGGIGGVHRQAPFDVSADLTMLGRTPMVVVCAGAKAILDLPATLEMLETLCVPVVGYQTDELPAFYSRSSGLPLSIRCDTPKQVAEIARAHWELGQQSAVLVTVPVPVEAALPANEVQGAIDRALDEAHAQHITGQAVTPFLLRRVSELTGGASLKANLALLLNNARVAAQIALNLK